MPGRNSAESKEVLTTDIPPVSRCPWQCGADVGLL